MSKKPGPRKEKWRCLFPKHTLSPFAYSFCLSLLVPPDQLLYQIQKFSLSEPLPQCLQPCRYFNIVGRTDISGAPQRQPCLDYTGGNADKGKEARGSRSSFLNVVMDILFRDKRSFATTHGVVLCILIPSLRLRLRLYWNDWGNNQQDYASQHHPKAYIQIVGNVHAIFKRIGYDPDCGNNPTSSGHGF